MFVSCDFHKLDLNNLSCFQSDKIHLLYNMFKQMTSGLICTLIGKNNVVDGWKTNQVEKAKVQIKYGTTKNSRHIKFINVVFVSQDRA